MVLDGCDNFATRHAVNRACVKHRKPLVSGAGVRFDGQISVFDMRDDDAPCYACLFPEDAQSEEVRCAVMGVFAPLTGIVGCIQAAEALKVLTGAGTTLAGQLMLIDALTMDIRTIKLKKDPVLRGVQAAVIRRIGVAATPRPLTTQRQRFLRCLKQHDQAKTKRRYPYF